MVWGPNPAPWIHYVIFYSCFLVTTAKLRSFYQRRYDLQNEQCLLSINIYRKFVDPCMLAPWRQRLSLVCCFIPRTWSIECFLSFFCPQFPLFFLFYPFASLVAIKGTILWSVSFKTKEIAELWWKMRTASLLSCVPGMLSDQVLSVQCFVDEIRSLKLTVTQTMECGSNKLWSLMKFTKAQNQENN